MRMSHLFELIARFQNNKINLINVLFDYSCKSILVIPNTSNLSHARSNSSTHCYCTKPHARAAQRRENRYVVAKEREYKRKTLLICDTSRHHIFCLFDGWLK